MQRRSNSVFVGVGTSLVLGLRSGKMMMFARDLESCYSFASQSMRFREGDEAANIHHYTSAVTSCLKAQRWKEAVELLDRMEVGPMETFGTLYMPDELMRSSRRP